MTGLNEAGGGSEADDEEDEGCLGWTHAETADSAMALVILLLPLLADDVGFLAVAGAAASGLRDSDEWVLGLFDLSDVDGCWRELRLSRP